MPFYIISLLLKIVVIPDGAEKGNGFHLESSVC